MSAGAGSPPVVHLRDTFSSRAGGNGATIVCKMGRVELARCIGAALHGLDIECDSLELIGCTTNENAQCGVRLRTRGSMELTDLTSNDNGWQGALLLPVLSSVQEKANKHGARVARNGFGLPGGGAGIECSGLSSVTMQDVECFANAGSGIVIADMDRDGALDRVTCSANGGHGVHVTSTQGLPGGRMTVRGAVCDGNTSNGLFLEGTSGGQVTQCVGSNNGGVGIFVIGSAHVVCGNSVLSNSGAPMIVNVPGNIVGPMVDELSVAGNCNPAANYVH